MLTFDQDNDSSLTASFLLCFLANPFCFFRFVWRLSSLAIAIFFFWAFLSVQISISDIHMLFWFDYPLSTARCDWNRNPWTPYVWCIFPRITKASRSTGNSFWILVRFDQSLGTIDFLCKKDFERHHFRDLSSYFCVLDLPSFRRKFVLFPSRIHIVQSWGEDVDNLPEQSTNIARYRHRGSQYSSALANYESQTNGLDFVACASIVCFSARVVFRNYLTALC